MLLTRAFSSIVSVTKKTPRIYVAHDPFDQVAMKCRFSDVKIVMGCGDKSVRWTYSSGYCLVLERATEYKISGRKQIPHFLQEDNLFSGHVKLRSQVSKDIVKIMDEEIYMRGGWDKTFANFSTYIPSIDHRFAGDEKEDEWTFRLSFSIFPLKVATHTQLIRQFEELWDVKAYPRQT